MSLPEKKNHHEKAGRACLSVHKVLGSISITSKKGEVGGVRGKLKRKLPYVSSEPVQSDTTRFPEVCVFFVCESGSCYLVTGLELTVILLPLPLGVLQSQA